MWRRWTDKWHMHRWVTAEELLEKRLNAMKKAILTSIRIERDKCNVAAIFHYSRTYSSVEQLLDHGDDFVLDLGFLFSSWQFIQKSFSQTLAGIEITWQDSCSQPEDSGKSQDSRHSFIIRKHWSFKIPEYGHKRKERTNTGMSCQKM